ncbi:hypothetical protein [Aliiroseovarius sp. xm-a-151]|uniref:hypothetical protein n=1 Tax=Aliiroseovarius sp. xm-a-151 TaxID=2651824 RepID=UPI0015684581|nr:hypothetical protein [Aliiroseovarius sp. xm-a-151]
MKIRLQILQTPRKYAAVLKNPEGLQNCKVLAAKFWLQSFAVQIRKRSERQKAQKKRGPKPPFVTFSRL